MKSQASHVRLALLPVLVLALLPLRSGAGDWSQWRGVERKGHASPGSPGIAALPKDFKPAWKLSIGGGFSSPIVAGGKVIYLDAQENMEVVHAVDAATGRELWKHELATAFGDEWDTGPRSTPFADGDRLFVQSCNGEFRCLSLGDGRQQWRANFEDFGVRFLGSKAKEGTAARRGNNGSGVADEQHVYVPVGSTNGATIVAFDKRTGKKVWQSQTDEAAYSSLLVARLAGVRQVVAFTAEALVGLDPATGERLWRVPYRTAAKRHAATPVIFGDLVIVNSHTFGLVATRISKSGEKLVAAEAWANKAMKINLSTPVLVGEHLYSLGANRDFVCVEAATGKQVWSAPGFGKGTKDNCSIIAVHQRLLVLTEDGQLALVAADPSKFTELGRLQVCGNTWCYPAFADGKLYVRDGRELVCLDLTAK